MLTANGLVKLLEELGELSQVAAKKLAYYHTDEHPDGAGSLKRRMQEEMGDVIGAIGFVVDQFGLDRGAIDARARKKVALFEKWHAEQDNNDRAFDSAAEERPMSVAEILRVQDDIRAAGGK